MITYALESWDTYAKEAPSLWAAHYEELCRAELKPRKPMSPDGPFFQFCESRGMLQVLTGRKAGVMVAYSVVIVRRHSHYDILAGFEDAYFLTSAERGAGQGTQLVNAALYHLRRRGVQEVYFMTHSLCDRSKMFEKLGFALQGKCYSKWLSAPEGVLEA